MVSVSMVRFDDGSLLDVPRVAAACHAQGALLLLDVSQCCGALPMDVNQLGADFMVCAGYKWLLGPFGTGFFWAKSEHISKMRSGPFYWMATEGAENFAALAFADPKPRATYPISRANGASSVSRCPFWNSAPPFPCRCPRGFGQPRPGQRPAPPEWPPFLSKIAASNRARLMI